MKVVFDGPALAPVLVPSLMYTVGTGDWLHTHEQIAGCRLQVSAAGTRNKLLIVSRRFERRNPGEVVAQHQGVDVMGALVGHHGLQIHEVPHDGVLVDDAVGAVDLARGPGAFAGHPDVVPLGQ